MNAHPCDAVVEYLVRQARLVATQRMRPGTRAVGEHSLRQCSAGRLIVETCRADAVPNEGINQARRAQVAAEFERRRMPGAATAARAAPEILAEHHRPEQAGGAQIAAAVTALTGLGVSEKTLVDTLDRAIRADHNLTTVQKLLVAGAPQVGLTGHQVAEELMQTGADFSAQVTLPPTVDNPSHAVGGRGHIPTGGADLSPTPAPAPERESEPGPHQS